MIKLYKEKWMPVSQKARVFQEICKRLRLLNRTGKPGKIGVPLGSIMMCILISFNSAAQHISPAVLNSAGASYSGNDMICEWSVGELALVETMINSQAALTNGLLQPLVPAQIITNGFVVYPTNVLTPNGDGSNDVWFIKDLDRYPDNEISIYDRAGRRVYYAKGYQNDWTGTFSGAPLAEDTYYYIIRLTKEGKQSFPIKGFITIIR